VGLTGEDFENALSAFQEFDRDRDGMLNRSDIAYAMGLDLKEQRVGLAMNALDIDGKGNVDFKAFTIALCHLRFDRPRSQTLNPKP
jgi:Ca2+-binding EF-hand superfamily protein